MNEFNQGPITSLGVVVETFVINVEQLKKKKKGTYDKCSQLMYGIW